MKNLLILGGLGFIGTNFVEELLTSDGDFNILIYDQPGKHNKFGSQIKIIYGDFNTSTNLETLFSEEKIDIVIHLISNTVPASSNERIIYDIESNLIPTINLLKLLARYKVPEVIFFSSGGSVYGTTEEEKVNELHQTFPISSHGTIKLTIEKYIHLFQELYGINYLILRVGNPYGPHQTAEDQGVINVFLRKVLRNEKLIVRGDGSSVRDYIYVGDLSVIVRKLIERGIKNEILNIGSGQGVSVNEIISVLKSVTGKETKIEYSDPLLSDVPRIILDTSKLSSLVKTDLTSLEEGIRKTIEKLESQHPEL